MFKPDIDGIIIDTVHNTEYRVLKLGARCVSPSILSICKTCFGKIQIINLSNNVIHAICIWDITGKLYKNYRYISVKELTVPDTIIQVIL